MPTGFPWRILIDLNIDSCIDCISLAAHRNGICGSEFLEQYSVCTNQREHRCYYHDSHSMSKTVRKDSGWTGTKESLQWDTQDLPVCSRCSLCLTSTCGFSLWLLSASLVWSCSRTQSGAWMYLERKANTSSPQYFSPREKKPAVWGAKPSWAQLNSLRGSLTWQGTQEGLILQWTDSTEKASGQEKVALARRKWPLSVLSYLWLPYYSAPVGGGVLLYHNKYGGNGTKTSPHPILTH